MSNTIRQARQFLQYVGSNRGRPAQWEPSMAQHYDFRHILFLPMRMVWLNLCQPYNDPFAKPTQKMKHPH